MSSSSYPMEIEKSQIPPWQMLYDQELVTELHEYNLVKDAKQEGQQEERVRNAKNLMDTLGLSVEQVMAALKIPEEDREIYQELLVN